MDGCVLWELCVVR